MFCYLQSKPSIFKKGLWDLKPPVCNFKSIYVDFSFLPNHIFPSKAIWFPCLSVQDTSATFLNFLSHLMVIFHQEIKFFSLCESPCLHDDQRTVCSVWNARLVPLPANWSTPTCQQNEKWPHHGPSQSFTYGESWWMKNVLWVLAKGKMPIFKRFSTKRIKALKKKRAS